MKKIIGIIFILAFVSQANAQKVNTSQDSMKVFYDKMIGVMKKGYLHKKEVKWKELEVKVEGNLKQYPNFQSSLKEVATVFDFTKADHGIVRYKDVQYHGSFPVITTKDFSEQWQKKFSTKPKFEVKVLDNEIGYILMPGTDFQDYSSDFIHSVSQPMYDEICKIKRGNNIKGWIIDLRFNTGGDCRPMILALYDFLGDNEVWGVLNVNKKKKSSVKLSQGIYLEDGFKDSFINPDGMLLEKARVAVITNLATASSGEVTALAFKGRENTKFIGQRTNGQTTTNILVDLPFTADMALTVGIDCDRNGNFYDHLVPDVAIVNQDNFDQLSLDGNIMEAKKFILN